MYDESVPWGRENRGDSFWGEGRLVGVGNDEMKMARMEEGKKASIARIYKCWRSIFFV